MTFLNDFRSIDVPAILLTIVGFQTPRYMQELNSDIKYLQEILSTKESYVFLELYFYVCYKFCVIKCTI